MFALPVARQLPELLQDVAGRVDLVVTSPPYACDAGVIDKPAWRAGHPMCPRDTLNYSRDPANLGHARGQAWRSGIAEVLAGCAWLLRPGGLAWVKHGLWGLVAFGSAAAATQVGPKINWLPLVMSGVAINLATSLTRHRVPGEFAYLHDLRKTFPSAASPAR